MTGLRVATLDDGDEIDALMKASIAAIFPTTYDARQTASSVIHIGQVDRQLIEDGTLFVAEDGGAIVASGGWSKRRRLFVGAGAAPTDAGLLDPETEPARVRAMFVRGDHTRQGLGTLILEACEAAARDAGFRRLSLMATLPGIPLYARFGFVETQRVTITLADGVPLACAEMERSIRDASSPPGRRPARTTLRPRAQRPDRPRHAHREGLPDRRRHRWR